MSDKSIEERLSELEEETRDMQARLFELEQAVLHLDQEIKKIISSVPINS